jgi:hypothetical protein
VSTILSGTRQSGSLPVPSISDDERLLRELYLPQAGEFVLVDVPEMRFLMIDGSGDHRSQAFAYGTRWLMSVLEPIKPMARERMGTRYAEPPLEVLWWSDDMSDFIAGKRDKFRWRQMIVMADWVDDGMIDHAIAMASRRLGDAPSSLRLDRFDEGTCAQIMHVGLEDDAVPTMDRLHNEFLAEHQLVATGYFHEIYLSDPKRVAPEEMRTVLRQPVAPVREGST